MTSESQVKLGSRPRAVRIVVGLAARYPYGVTAADIRDYSGGTPGEVRAALVWLRNRNLVVLQRTLGEAQWYATLAAHEMWLLMVRDS